MAKPEFEFKTVTTKRGWLRSPKGTAEKTLRKWTEKGWEVVSATPYRWQGQMTYTMRRKRG